MKQRRQFSAESKAQFVREPSPATVRMLCAS